MGEKAKDEKHDATASSGRTGSLSYGPFMAEARGKWGAAAAQRTAEDCTNATSRGSDGATDHIPKLSAIAVEKTRLRAGFLHRIEEDEESNSDGRAQQGGHNKHQE
jgi:hypothetical protein